MGKLDDELRLKELRGRETLKASPRNKYLGAAADLLKPAIKPLDKYEVDRRIPLLGGTTMADLTGLKGTQSLLEDLSYGAPLVRNARNIQTAQPDKRLLDVAGFIPAVGMAAKATKGLPVGMTVKDVGGQWESTAANRLERELRDKYDNKDITNWLQTVGRKYLMNRSGSPEDEIRKLADKGILHIDPQDMRRGFEQTDRDIMKDVIKERKKAGYPAEGQAETDLGRRWELKADAMIQPFKAEDLLYSSSAKAEMPWLEKVAPETPVYGHLLSDVPDYLGFDKINAAIRQGIAEGTLRPENLNRLTMADAVTLAHNQRVARELAEQQTLEALPKIREYPEGYAWHELTHEDPETLKKLLKKEGDIMQNCISGYCEDVLDDGTKLYSLRDTKGEPHVNIEVRPKSVVFSDMVDYLGPERANELLEEHGAKGIIDMFPELRQYDIRQIKGKQNEAPIADYLPYVQDFIKNPTVEKGYSEIGDLENAGMLDVSRLKEHGLNDIGSVAGRKIQAELGRVFPTDIDQFGGRVLSGQHGLRIPSYDMMREAVKDLEGRYMTQDELLSHLQAQEPRPVEQGYSNYWKEQNLHPELLNAIEAP